MEEIENELCLNHGKKTILIRLGYGNQSESIVGMLEVFTTTFPIKFGVNSLGVNVLFTATDVKSITEQTESEPLIITLKGPSDYSA